MGFLNRSGFASSIQPEVQLLSTAVSLTLTGLQDMRVFADTTSAALTITLPSGTRGQTIEIVDAGDNAGTNIITVAGSIDGVTNTTIETDGATRVFVFNTAWESGGGIERLFTRNAALGRITSKDPDALAANQLLGGDTGTTYTGSPSNFQQAEANVSQGASGWGNLQSLTARINNNTTANSPIVITDDGNESATYAGWKAFDGNTVSFSSISSGTSTPAWIKIDLGFGTLQTFTAVQIGGSNTTTTNPTSYKVEGSNDDSAWTELATTTLSSSIVGPDYLPRLDFSATGSYRYYKLTVLGITAGTWWAPHEIKYYTGVFTTTTNTFQYRPLTAGSITNFDTSTATFKDETGTNLTDSDILIEFDLAGDSSWSTPQNITDFKANGILTGTNMWFRFEMVGAKKLGSTSITTASSYAEMLTGSMKLRDQGIVTSALLNSTQQVHTLTGAGPTQDLNLGAYNNFLIDLNDATVGATLTWSNAIMGQTYYIRVRQGDNGIDVTWPGSVQTAGGTGVSAITATSNSEDLFVMYFDGLNDVMILQLQNLS